VLFRNKVVPALRQWFPPYSQPRRLCLSPWRRCLLPLGGTLMKRGSCVLRPRVQVATTYRCDNRAETGTVPWSWWSFPYSSMPI
jgi:hypothetical protein